MLCLKRSSSAARSLRKQRLHIFGTFGRSHFLHRSAGGGVERDPEISKMIFSKIQDFAEKEAPAPSACLDLELARFGAFPGLRGESLPLTLEVGTPSEGISSDFAMPPLLSRVFLKNLLASPLGL